jgi:hypothetical protein
VAEAWMPQALREPSKAGHEILDFLRVTDASNKRRAPFHIE